jgi:hypothetical protein
MAKKKPKQNQPQDPIQKELEAIKRLLMFFLYKTGVSQGELAIALQVDQAEVSRMMPARKIKSYNSQKEKR